MSVQSIALKSGPVAESEATPASVAPRPPERFDPQEAQMTVMNEIAQMRIANEIEGARGNMGAVLLRPPLTRKALGIGSAATIRLARGRKCIVALASGDRRDPN